MNPSLRNIPLKGSTLQRSIRYLKGVGEERAARLSTLGVRTVGDLLQVLPSRYYDRSRLTPMARVRVGETETIQGRVVAMRHRSTPRRRMAVTEAEVEDETGRITAVWFNQRWVAHSVQAGDELILSGRIQFFGGLQIHPVELEIVTHDDYVPIHAKGVIPGYTLAEGISSRLFRRLIWRALEDAGDEVAEILPDRLRSAQRLMDARSAIRAIHFPKTPRELQEARRRWAYEELFLFQVMVARHRLHVKQLRGIPLKVSPGLDFRIRSLYPYSLTKAQERAIADVRNDVSKPHPMNRLLQGDVGSGKTTVAAYAVLCAIGNHAQAAILAPTEILADQHHRTFTRLLSKSQVRIGFLEGGLRGQKRLEFLDRIKNGEVDLTIGTHALLEEDVVFKNLALVVVDEQQRFGVLQRAGLRKKGIHPHTLVMTATPIPRTLSLSLYGDLDVSVIDEMPPGRIPVRTLFRPREKLSAGLEFIRGKLREGRQAYFVYPLIDPSDKLPLRSAKEMFEILKKVYPNFTVELLHGRIKPRVKEQIMERFRLGSIHILVSTLVIEVGIDVPNASVMVIDHAERYGLAQVHQLRGRIGRGSHESYCILFGEKNERIQALISTNDGFKIAEEDLRLRGTGEFFGTRQSGLPEFRVANPLADPDLLALARQDAFAFVGMDRALATPEGARIRTALKHRYGGRLPLASVG